MMSFIDDILREQPTRAQMLKEFELKVEATVKELDLRLAECAGHLRRIEYLLGREPRLYEINKRRIDEALQRIDRARTLSDEIWRSVRHHVERELRELAGLGKKFEAQPQG